MNKTEMLRTLESIHANALQGFTYVSDEKKHRLLEQWDMPSSFWRPGMKFTGDCDDFAMHCREACKAAGLNARLVICYTETGEGHLVCECHGYILDNRYKKVAGNKSPQFRGYQWLFISGYEPGDPWHEIVPLDQG